MKKLTFEVEFITPAFIGGASQQAELRPASFVGLLRWWWRLILASFVERSEEVYKYEGALLGSQDSMSRLALRIRPVSGNVRPERIDTYYMLGMGGRNRECIPAGLKFYLDVIYRDVSEELVRSLFELAISFGGVGYRSRKGFGNMRMVGKSPNFQLLKREFWERLLAGERLFREVAGKGGMGYEVPNLGNLVLMKYEEKFKSWQEALEKLGNIYRSLRVANGKTPEYATGIYSYLRNGTIDVNSFTLKNHIFGLPIMYRSRSMSKYVAGKNLAPQAQINWTIRQKETEEESDSGDRRRASPFVFLVKEDGILVLGFRCRYLPEGSQILIQPKGKYWREQNMREPRRYTIPFSEQKYAKDFEDAIDRLKRAGFREVVL